MKKTIILIFTFIISSLAYSQLDFGIRGGVTTSKLYTNLNDYNSENIIGYQAGAFLRIFTGKHLFIQPEGYVTRKGGNLTSSSEEKKYEVQINSIDVPVLLGLKFLDLKVTRLTVYGGPVISFASKRTINYYEDGIQVVPPDPHEKINSTNWGLQAGASVDVLIFTVDVRHEWGMNDILDDPSAELKNGVWLIGLGIRLF
jgi:hypothetical protein